MNRSFIVPDAFCFYLLSAYRISNFESLPQLKRDLHMGKIMWVVNQAVGRQVFTTPYTVIVDRYMKKHKNVTVGKLLESEDYSDFK
jgi:hypothetical protein